MSKQRLSREKNNGAISVYYRGVRYDTLEHLANDLELTKNQIRVALTDNYREEILDQDVTFLLDSHFTGRKCYIAFNKNFFTLPEIADYIGLDKDLVYSVYQKTKNRFEFEEEVMKRILTEPFTYKKVKYESLRVFCSKNDVDYSNFVRWFSSGKYTIEEALNKEVVLKIRKEINFRGETYPNKRILYKHYGFYRTVDLSLREAFPNVDPLVIFDMYLDFAAENNLPTPEETLSVIPMYFYNGKYYPKSRDFYSEIGITTRQFSNEGLRFRDFSDVEVLRNMKTRLHQKTGILLFPDCKIDVEVALVSVKKTFYDLVKKRLS